MLLALDRRDHPEAGTGLMYFAVMRNISTIYQDRIATVWRLL
jgi:hypothetical protein